MSQTKYPLPDDVKITCIGYVKGYERRVTEYLQERDNIIRSPSAMQVQTYIGRNNQVNRPNETKSQQLDRLESSRDTQIMRAVEHAKLLAGADLPDNYREALVKAVWDSSIFGKRFVFSHYKLPMGKTAFYEHRRKFLWDIASYLGHVE